MRLFQIPFSHNCIKVRHVLDLKGITYETVNINPALRGEVKRVSGQELVPTLVDRGHVVSGSTPILLYLEEHHPDPALLPDEPQQWAECIALMNWADGTFMALTRRLAYFQVLSVPERLGQMFFPHMAPAAQRVAGRGSALVLRLRFGIDAERNRRDEESARRAARVAVDRLAGEEHLVGDRLTLADITLAAMTAPLQYTKPRVREDPHVEALLRWGSGVLGVDFTPLRPPTSGAVYQT
jgi:glutathione S-transferase